MYRGRGQSPVPGAYFKLETVRRDGRLKKAVSNEVNRLKIEWLSYDFCRAFDFDLLNNVAIQDKEVNFLRRNKTKIRKDVFKLLEPLALSHKHIRPDWKDYYYNKKVEIIDSVDLQKKVKFIRTRPRPLYLDWYDDYLCDLSEIIAEYKAIEFVESDIRKVAENYIDDSEKSAPVDNFRTTVVLKAVEIASDVFKGNRYPVYCNPNCRERGRLKCKYTTDISRSLEDCPKNSHIQKLKKEQKQRSAKGYVPEIAYLLAKYEVLRIDGCDLQTGSCEKSNCLTVQLNQCRQKVDQILNKSSIPKLYSYLEKELNPVPKTNCRNKVFRDNIDFYPVCAACEYREKFKDIIKFIQSISQKQNNLLYVTDYSFKKEKDLLTKLTLPIFNPCPKATEQVSKIITDQNKRRKPNIRIVNYAKVYLYYKLKGNKKGQKIVLDELKEAFPDMKPNTIIQKLNRKVKEREREYSQISSDPQNPFI